MGNQDGALSIADPIRFKSTRTAPVPPNLGGALTKANTSGIWRNQCATWFFKVAWIELEGFRLFP